MVTKTDQFCIQKLKLDWLKGTIKGFSYKAIDLSWFSLIWMHSYRKESLTFFSTFLKPLFITFALSCPRTPNFRCLEMCLKTATALASLGLPRHVC